MQTFSFVILVVIIEAEKSRSIKYLLPASNRELVKLVVVRFGKQLLNVFAVTSLLEEFAERVVAKLTSDKFQSAQVILRIVRRRNKQEQNINGFAVKAVKLDAFVAHCYGAN